jgi:peptide/nickel transport system substrate-binding protein
VETIECTGTPFSSSRSLKVIPDATTRALEMRKGSIDVAQNVLSVVEVCGSNLALISRPPGTNYGYIGFNLNDSIVRDSG